MVPLGGRTPGSPARGKNLKSLPDKSEMSLTCKAVIPCSSVYVASHFPLSNSFCIAPISPNLANCIRSSSSGIATFFFASSSSSTCCSPSEWACPLTSGCVGAELIIVSKGTMGAAAQLVPLVCDRMTGIRGGATGATGAKVRQVLRATARSFGGPRPEI